MTVEHWKREPEDHDYPAATSYLSLLVGAEAATKLVRKLQKQDVLVHRAAKDLLRASRLQLSGTDDSEVAADLKKIKGGPSSPLFYWCREIRCGWPMAITGFGQLPPRREGRSPLPNRPSPVSCPLTIGRVQQFLPPSPGPTQDGQ